MGDVSLNNFSLIPEFQFQQPKCFFSNYFQLRSAVLISCLDGENHFKRQNLFPRGKHWKPWLGFIAFESACFTQGFIVFSLRLRALMNAPSPVFEWWRTIFKWDTLCKFGSIGKKPEEPVIVEGSWIWPVLFTFPCLYFKSLSDAQ